MKTVAQLRAEYARARLDEKDVAADPLDQFRKWFDEAVAAEAREPNAMAVATVGAGGRPAVRMVLLKGFEGGRFVFYTNRESRKGQELAAHPAASLLFWWPELERQVRIEGAIAPVGDAESDAYFATRPRGSQLGAWASDQSRPIPSREVLERRLAEAEARFAGRPVERPPYWGGYAVLPAAYEFWQGRPSRLHDRILYTRAAGGSWQLGRLSP